MIKKIMQRSMDSPFKDRKAQLSVIREYKLAYEQMKREFPGKLRNATLAFFTMITLKLEYFKNI